MKSSTTIQGTMYVTVKTFGLLQPYFGDLSCMHTCCVSETLYELHQGMLLKVQLHEKLLLFAILGSSCRKPINQHFWYKVWCFFDPTHPTLEEFLGSMVMAGMQPIARRSYNLTKKRSVSTTLELSIKLEASYKFEVRNMSHTQHMRHATEMTKCG